LLRPGIEECQSTTLLLAFRLQKYTLQEPTGNTSPNYFSAKQQPPKSVDIQPTESDDIDYAENFSVQPTENVDVHIVDAQPTYNVSPLTMLMSSLSKVLMLFLQEALAFCQVKHSSCMKKGYNIYTDENYVQWLKEFHLDHLPPNC